MCYLYTHGGAEKIKADVKTRAQINIALRETKLSYDADLRVRHVCEVLVKDVGIDRIASQVTNPLKGLKVAGYVGCQTVRPFAGTEGGGKFDATDEPTFLDDFPRACGAEALAFPNKTSCCGVSVAVMSPDRTLAPHQGDPHQGAKGGCRTDIDALPATPDQCADVPGGN